MIRLTRIARPALVLAASLGLSSPAAAQGVDPAKAAAAQALYDQATADMDAKSYVVACPRLEEVVRLAPDGLGARMTLGQCYEALGKLASAWSQYALIEVQAAKRGQAERSQRARDRAAALRPRLAVLVIEVPSAARAIPGLSVVRDGVPVGEPQWGVPMPVDTGAHEILVSAPGYKPWKKSIEVVADGAKLSATVPALKPDPLSAAGPAAAPAQGRTWYRSAGIPAMAVGAAGIGVGALLGGLAIAKNAESKRDNHCDAKDTCDATGLALRNLARGLGNGSTAAFVVGGLILASGVVLFATGQPAPAGKERATRGDDHFAAQLSLTAGGFTVKGVW
ncbi:MAG: hypothetical protein QM820_45675 [Minicystis sp.]